MKEELTMEFVKSLMDESYTLAWVDCRDSFNDNYALIQKCLNENSPESLWESIDGWYSDSEWESIKGIIEKLKEECSLFHDFDEEEVESFFEEHDDEIRNEIYARDDSTVLTDLIRHTDDIPIRVEMLSDNDCINSHWWESLFGGYGRCVKPQSCQGEEDACGEGLHGTWPLPRQKMQGQKGTSVLRTFLSGAYQFLLRGEPADLYRESKPEGLI